MIPGVTRARRFKVSDVRLRPHKPRSAHRYLAIYEIEGTDAAAVNDEIEARTGSGDIAISEAFDLDGCVGFYWESAEATIEDTNASAPNRSRPEPTA